MPNPELDNYINNPDKEWIKNTLKVIQDCLHYYSTWFVDWELMYNNKEYKPKFPDHLLEAVKAIKTLQKNLLNEN